MAERHPPGGPLSRLAIFLLFGGLLLILALLWVANQVPRVKKTASAEPVPAATPALGAGAIGAAGAGSRPSASAAASAAPATAAAAPSPEAVAQLSAAIERTLAALNDPSVKDKKAALAALREAIEQGDPAAGIAAIRQFLANGRDASTGLGFKVGDGGTLAEAPTLRTFLLDQLGTLSEETGATDAADVANSILSTKGSADEWALALRNLAWADPDGSKPALAAKVRELINYQPWQSAPTGGYLEAFDVAAYSGDPTLIADLAPLSRTPSAVQQAALVALERLSALAPAEVADYLNANPSMLADAPMIRADYMGNMDLSDSSQISAAETYLQRTDVSQAEKEKFLARLGMPAGFVSDNLLTPADAATMPLAEHRALVNETATEWLASGQYPALQTSLQSLIQHTQPINP